MKKTIALLLVTSALALTGCSTTRKASYSDSKRTAIESVFAQRAALEAKNGRAGLLSKQGLPKLMGIDVRRCPADFRSAWFDYLVADQDLRTRMERVAMFAAAAGKPARDVPSLVKFAVSNPRLGQYLLGAVNRTDEAWNRLDRTAMNYDVFPMR